ncbi:dephospho-CoA kinase [uncultured Duncaniella sp.]|uniref:dephospho-CoA kinase n=1 Tax=uncultured Duncaniella sp. TaxID=2768039 RepID=UPI00265F516A|nr:dephospho-CoA kinase [uncultured Duncaniella sp.]
MERLIAITGGIGSGKSVVSRIVSAMGYPVYDCDTQARRLMDRSDSIKSAIAELIAPSCIINGEIDRAALSAEVFSSAEKLECLNGIVHGAVREHLAMWSSHPDRATGIRFVETAILYQSGLDTMVDEVWQVDAPEELRIQRVMARNAMSRSQVTDRIKSQDSYIPAILHRRTRLIINDGDAAVLPQVERLIDELA